MSKEIGIFVAGAMAGALVLFLVGNQFSPVSPTKTQFKVTGPKGNGSIELNVEGESIDYEKILETMFSNDFLRPAAAGWLAEKQGLYNIDREELATAIATKLCEPIPQEPLNVRLAKGRACAEKLLAARLRELALKRRPPFHHVGKEGKMGYPSIAEHRPRAGFANVCRHGDYYGRRLQIVNPQNGELVEVQADGHYNCTPATTFPDVQLGVKDIERLLGNRPLQELENVIVVTID